MSYGVIYPNNSVELDGESLFWDESHFKKYNIPLVRISKKINEDAYHVCIDGVDFVVFYTYNCHNVISIRTKKINNPFKNRRTQNVSGSVS